MFNRHGNKTNYSSTGKNPEEATFVFDFGNLCSYPTDWKNYYLYFTNISRVYPITVKNIKLIDKMGNVVLEDVDDKLLYNEEYLSKYLIAMVGDVDNSGTIDSNDTTLLQQYTAYITEFTDDQMTVADVTGDGSVNIFDAAYISAYIAGEINELPNGSYVYLG